VRRPLALLILPALLACNEVTGSFSDIIALQVEGPPARRIEEGTTLQLVAAALDLSGTPVSADILWAIVDTAAGITVDTVSGLVTAVRPGGPWRVQARVETLRADPVQVTVAGAPDSAAAVGDTILIASGTGPSPAMTVKVFDLTSSPGTAPGLAGVPVRFLVVAPVSAGIVLRGLASADTTAIADSITITSGASGQAAVVLSATGTAPDSVMVDAVVSTAAGSPVAGSPVRFIVRFQ